MDCHKINKSKYNNRVPLILLGAGGHAKVVAALIEAIGRRIIGVCDPALAAANVQEWRGLPVLGDDNYLLKNSPDTNEIALGVGMLPKSNIRFKIFQDLTKRGYLFPSLVHPRSVVDESAVVEDGSQIMAGVVIQADCYIGKNTIINTCASVDHDSKIYNHTHVAPGVVICGGVIIGNSTFIGASAIILPQIKIGDNCLISAGSRISKDLSDGERCVFK